VKSTCKKGREIRRGSKGSKGGERKEEDGRGRKRKGGVVLVSVGFAFGV